MVHIGWGRGAEGEELSKALGSSLGSFFSPSRTVFNTETQLSLLISLYEAFQRYCTVKITTNIVILRYVSCKADILALWPFLKTLPNTLPHNDD